MNRQHNDLKYLAKMERVVLAVPVDVLQYKILSFLSLKDLIHLDTATCNKAARKDMHLRLNGVCYPGDLAKKMNAKALKWLSVRKMSLENIYVHDKTSEKEFVEFSTVFAQTKTCQLN